MVTVVATTQETVWVERARRGDPVAFEALVRRYERQIHAFTCRMMGGNSDDADDLTQETFIKAHRALPRTADVLNTSAWLHRIAANCCRDEWRRRRRARCERWDPIIHGRSLSDRTEPGPEEYVLQREADAQVCAVLDRMRPRNRQALVLKEYAGLSCADIGAVMGVSHKAIKSTLFRAREEFRYQVAAG